VNGKWTALTYGWWTYGQHGSSSIISDSGAIELLSEVDLGLRYPQFDNLNAKGRFCVLRLKSSGGKLSGYFYVSVRIGDGKVILLSLSPAHSKEGWGEPRDEFMIKLPHLEHEIYKTFAIDLQALEPWIGKAAHVESFRLRRGFRVSHIGIVDELPIWLEEATLLGAQNAPMLTIQQPLSGDLVTQQGYVQGTYANLENANAINLFVLSPDGFWYRQPTPNFSNGQWQGKAYFGDSQHGIDREYTLAALVTDDSSIETKARNLPAASAKFTVKVIRRA
jgi:hypothetical protein